jgi:hypothetical protein
MIRQRLRPQRVDLEAWRLDGTRLCVDLVLEHGLAHTERHNECENRCADIEMTPL